MSMMRAWSCATVYGFLGSPLAEDQALSAAAM